VLLSFFLLCLLLCVIKLQQPAQSLCSSAQVTHSSKDMHTHAAYCSTSTHVACMHAHSAGSDTPQARPWCSQCCRCCCRGCHGHGDGRTYDRCTCSTAACRYAALCSTMQHYAGLQHYALCSSAACRSAAPLLDSCVLDSCVLDSCAQPAGLQHHPLTLVY
jgi:hypothetical protein